MLILSGFLDEFGRGQLPTLPQVYIHAILRPIGAAHWAIGAPWAGKMCGYVTNFEK
jgi:hypothetical protein